MVAQHVPVVYLLCHRKQTQSYRCLWYVSSDVLFETDTALHMPVVQCNVLLKTALQVPMGQSNVQIQETDTSLIVAVIGNLMFYAQSTSTVISGRNSAVNSGILCLVLVRMQTSTCQHVPVVQCIMLLKIDTAVLRVQELCESRGGRPGLSVLMCHTVSVKQH